MRDPFHEAEIEEAILLAERTVAELKELRTEKHRAEARWLQKMTRALRLALVADVEAGVLTRLHLRLETALRRAIDFVADPEGPPPSQRPTVPPPGAVEPAQERPTVRPVRSASDIFPKIPAPRAPAKRATGS
jgi:hypothetical protein